MAERADEGAGEVVLVVSGMSIGSPCIGSRWDKG
jgi:hypothetical protein